MRVRWGILSTVTSCRTYPNWELLLVGNEGCIYLALTTAMVNRDLRNYKFKNDITFKNVWVYKLQLIFCSTTRYDALD